MMSRLLLLACFCALVFAGCKKTDGTEAQRLAQGVIDDKLITDYIAANNLTTARKVLVGRADTTGIWYVIETAGAGSNLVTTSSLITVSYTGRILATGKEFVKTADFNPSFRLGETIRGWQLGILNTEPKLRKGGKVRLLIASRYAYGPFEQLAIPANSVLDFDIQIFDITN
jgi:FKBP-type peptidyl-prolyl cis-trans isomerase FkpA